MDLAAFINTRNRRGVTRRSVASFRACTSMVPLVAVDDGSRTGMGPQLAWGIDRVVSVGLRWARGPGHSRLAALCLFLGTQHEWGFFFDSDMIFGPGVGRWLKEASVVAEHHWPCVVSPYRSAHPAHLSKDEERDGWVIGSSYGGNTICLHRSVAEYLMLEMGPEQWGTMWDWNMVAVVPTAIKPVRSMCEHADIGQEDCVHPQGPNRPERGYGYR